MSMANAGMLLQSKSGSDNVWPMVGIGVGVIVVLLFLFLWAWKTLYKKPSADEAFVRTGMGGVKVFKDTAGLVIGLFHHMKWISLETMRLVVAREDKDAMITNDRLRVDMTAEFYIRVQPEENQILKAARSLGEKSLSPDSVKHLVEAKLVGALRSVAATKTLVELHENRDQFADAVQEALRNDLAQNGLTLEAVSIVKLDMTDKSIFDPNNIFDAVGLKSITDITQRQLTERNLIERQREVERKDQDVDAEKRRLTLDQDKEFAAAEQYKQVETYRAEQEATTQKFRIEQEQAVRERDIERERAVKEADIAREQRVREADIGKETYLVSKQQEREQAEILKNQAVEISKREAEIQVLGKEKEKELEAARQLEAVAEKERAAQQVLTVEKTEEAERQRQVIVIGQRADSEKDQIEKQIAADADAYEIKVRAAARLEAAENEAQAIERLAKAKLADAEAVAAGEQRLIEARNAMKNEVIIQDVLANLAERMPAIVAELMKPAEKISDMRVLNISGMGGTGADGGNSSPVGGILKSFLEAGAALPMFKEMLRMANVDPDKTTVGEALRRAAKAVPGVQKIADMLPESVRDVEISADDRTDSKA
jgi:uncharacterized membrane protein YqiK